MRDGEGNSAEADNVLNTLCGKFSFAQQTVDSLNAWKCDIPSVIDSAVKKITMWSNKLNK